MLCAPGRAPYPPFVISRLGDFFRFWWSLVYWNARKSFFRLRGRDAGSCPCQSASDSGIAMQTRCEAAATWNDPARFRRVCPLLTSTPDGLRCSAHTENVRPFWGRALGYYAALFAALYLGAGIAAYVGLRRIGYEVGLTTVLWPGNWSQMRAAQERMYARRAQEALAADNFQAAILALDMVCQLNPRNEPAALALANLWQISGRASLADGIYERLMREMPGHRSRIAQIWYRALLNRSDYAQIGRLAPRMLVEDPTQQAPWLHALFFATRATGDPAPLETARASSAKFPDWCNFLLTLEYAAQTGGLDAVQAQLTRVQADPGSPYVPIYQVQRLIAFGHYTAALKMLEGYAGRVPADEAGFLRLEAFTLLGWTSLTRNEFESLLAFPMRPRLAAQFCAFLLRFPDRNLLALYFDRFVKVGPNLEADTYPLYAATLLASARCGDPERVAYMSEIIRRITDHDPRALNQLVTQLVNHEELKRIDLILPAVPLPTEVIYALLDRYRPAAEAEPAAAKKTPTAAP